MKIIMLSEDYLPNIGGIAAHVFNVSRCIAGMGYSLDVVNPVQSDRDDVSVEEADGFHTHRVFVKSLKAPLLQRLWFNLRVYAYLLKILHRANDQHVIIHQHDYISTGLAANLGKLNNVIHIWTNHSSNFLSNFNKPIKKLIAKILYQRTNGIIAPSPELLEMSGKLWPNKERIYIPNGVNLEVFRPVSINEQKVLRQELHLPEDRIIVFCPRRWDNKNGIIYLIQALNTLQTRSADWMQRTLFVFAGNHGVHVSYEAQILRLIEVYDLHQHIRLLGEVPYHYINSYMKASDMIIVPSLMEAVSLAILEAMACGRIVIASNVGGIPEVVKDGQTGFLVQPGNVEELAGKIVEVCKLVAGGELGYMTNNARALVETGYSWEKVAEKTVGFYRQILGTDRGSSHRDI